MKVLVDPIHTNDVHLCSWNWKLKEVMKYALAQREDVFFYYLLPDENSRLKVDEDWLLKDDRIRYIRMPVSRDRMREYYHVPPELETLIQFYGPLWDWDVCITGRSIAVPLMTLAANRPGCARWASKKFVVVEDMPIMTYKECVPLVRPDQQDLTALAGYSATDCTFFMSFWEREATLEIARQWLSPSRVRALAGQMVDSSPIKIETTRLKTAEQIALTVARQRPFTIGFTQRFEKVHRRSEDVMEIFQKQWIRHSGTRPMRFLVTSNTASQKTAADMDYLDKFRAPRDEFHKMLREDMDVAIVLSIDDAYPLSLLEPLMFGVPCAVLAAPYALKTLGADYPFFCKSDTEAYGIVKAFADDYEKHYATFAAWIENSFVPLLKQRNEAWLPERMWSLLCRFESEVVDGARERGHGEVEIPSLLAQEFPTELVFEEAIKNLDDRGLVRSINANYHRTRESLVNSYHTDWHKFKRGLLARGYKDASIRVGHFTKEGS